jgi:hypothetical protein
MDNPTNTTGSDDFELFDDVVTVDIGANEGGERTPVNESASTDAEPTKKQPVNKDGLENNNKANNATTSKAEVDPNNKQSEKPKFVSRGEKRELAIKEALAEQKRVLEEIRREKSTPPQSNPQNQTQTATQQIQEPVFVEKPQAPQYAKEQLQTMAQRAQQEGNQEGLQVIRDELNKWDKYDIDLKFWKLENGKSMEKFQNDWNDNWNKAVEIVPELKDQQSESYKACDKLARFLPELMNRKQADGQLLIAKIYRGQQKLKTHAGEVAALKDQVTKLTDQLNASQKKLSPASQSSKPNISSSKDGNNADDRFAQKLGIAA